MAADSPDTSEGGLEEPVWSDQPSPELQRVIDARTAAVASAVTQGGGEDRPHGTLLPVGVFDPRQAVRSTSIRPSSYADLPRIARERFPNQPYRILLERTAPNDPRAKGLLGSFQEIPDSEFATRFGGGSYRAVLYVEIVVGGNLIEKAIEEVKFSIPGHPILSTNPLSPAPAGPGYAPGPAGWSNQRVEEIRAKQEADTHHTLLTAALQSRPGVSKEWLESQTEMQRITIAALERQLEEKTRTEASLREALTRANETLSEREMAYRKQIHEVDESADRRIKDARLEAEKTAEAKYEAKLTAAQDEARRAHEASNSRIDAERSRADARIRDIEDAKIRECDAIRRHAQMAEDTLRAAHERALESERNERDRALRSMKESFESQLTAATNVHTQGRAMASEGHQQLLQMKTDEVLSLRAEVSRLTNENNAMRDKIYKPVLEQAKEIQQLAPMFGYERKDKDDEEPAAPPPQSLVEKFVAGAPALASALGPVLAPLLGRAFGLPGAPPGAPPQAAPGRLPQAPVTVTQAPPPAPVAPPPRPRRTVAPIIGTSTPTSVDPVIQERPRQVEVPPPPSSQGPAAPIFEPIAKPARFQERGPQPASPGEIESVLALVTEQGRESIAKNVTAEAKAAEILGLLPEQAEAFTRWVDADNALLLLEKQDPIFWGREDVREWFVSFWGHLSTGPAGRKA